VSGAVARSRAAAVLSFILHTVRLAIYLSPGRGLRQGPANETGMA
jgi:hypothetical protein